MAGGTAGGGAGSPTQHVSLNGSKVMVLVTSGAMWHIEDLSTGVKTWVNKDELEFVNASGSTASARGGGGGGGGGGRGGGDEEQCMIIAGGGNSGGGGTSERPVLSRANVWHRHIQQAVLGGYDGNVDLMEVLSSTHPDSLSYNTHSHDHNHSPGYNHSHGHSANSRGPAIPGIYMQSMDLKPTNNPSGDRTVDGLNGFTGRSQTPRPRPPSEPRTAAAAARGGGRGGGAGRGGRPGAAPTTHAHQRPQSAPMWGGKSRGSRGGGSGGGDILYSPRSPLGAEADELDLLPLDESEGRFGEALEAAMAPLHKMEDALAHTLRAVGRDGSSFLQGCQDLAVEYNRKAMSFAADQEAVANAIANANAAEAATDTATDALTDADTDGEAGRVEAGPESPRRSGKKRTPSHALKAKRRERARKEARRVAKQRGYHAAQAAGVAGILLQKAAALTDEQGFLSQWPAVRLWLRVVSLQNIAALHGRHGCQRTAAHVMQMARTTDDERQALLQTDGFDQFDRDENGFIRGDGKAWSKSLGPLGPSGPLLNGPDDDDGSRVGTFKPSKRLTGGDGEDDADDAAAAAAEGSDTDAPPAVDNDHGGMMHGEGGYEYENEHEHENEHENEHDAWWAGGVQRRWQEQRRRGKKGKKGRRGQKMVDTLADAAAASVVAAANQEAAELATRAANITPLADEEGNVPPPPGHDEALGRLNLCAMANEAGEHGKALFHARLAIQVLLRTTPMDPMDRNTYVAYDGEFADPEGGGGERFAEYRSSSRPSSHGSRGLSPTRSTGDSSASSSTSGSRRGGRPGSGRSRANKRRAAPNARVKHSRIVAIALYNLGCAQQHLLMVEPGDEEKEGNEGKEGKGRKGGKVGKAGKAGNREGKEERQSQSQNQGVRSRSPGRRSTPRPNSSMKKSRRLTGGLAPDTGRRAGRTIYNAGAGATKGAAKKGVKGAVKGTSRAALVSFEAALVLASGAFGEGHPVTTRLAAAHRAAKALQPKGLPHTV